MSSGFNSWMTVLQYNINWKSKSAFAQMESERKRFGFLKEARDEWT